MTSKIDGAVLGKSNNIISTIWGEFIYSSHLVALGDVLALYALSLTLNISTNISFFIVVYLSILAINFFNRYEDADVDNLTNSERVDSVTKYFKFMPYIMGLLFISSLLITFFSAPIIALIFMVFLFGLGVFYSVCLKSITRRITGFKNIMTALPYALLVVFMSLYYGADLTMATLLVTIFYFCRIFINTTFFDVKDIASDKKEGLKTFPVIFGEKNTKLFLMLINILSVTPILLGVYLNILPLYSLAILITVAYPFLYLIDWNLFKKRTTLYNVVVDGEFIFWIVYLLAFRVFGG